MAVIKETIVIVTPKLNGGLETRVSPNLCARGTSMIFRENHEEAKHTQRHTVQVRTFIV